MFFGTLTKEEKDFIRAGLNIGLSWSSIAEASNSTYNNISEFIESQKDEVLDTLKKFLTESE